MGVALAINKFAEDRSTRTSILVYHLPFLRDWIAPRENVHINYENRYDDESTFAISDEIKVEKELYNVKKRLSEIFSISEDDDYNEHQVIRLEPKSVQITRFQIIEDSRAEFHFPYSESDYLDIDD